MGKGNSIRESKVVLDGEKAVGFYHVEFFRSRSSSTKSFFILGAVFGTKEISMDQIRINFWAEKVRGWAHKMGGKTMYLSF